MGLWRLELVRVWRTRRLIALAATFLILGLGSPVLTYYLPEIVKNSAGDMQITVPKQTAADGIASFASNAAQLGTLVVVVVAAATLAIDANPGLAAFYRTRVQSPIRLVLPRYVTVTAASVVTLTLGTLGAWYETAVLLGSVPVRDLFGGLALEALWLCFVTSIVLFFASTIRGVLGVVGTSIAVLLALALLHGLSIGAAWMPTRLSGGSAALVQHTTEGIWQAVLVSGLIAIATIIAAVYRFGTGEL